MTLSGAPMRIAPAAGSVGIAAASVTVLPRSKPYYLTYLLTYLTQAIAMYRGSGLMPDDAPCNCGYGKTRFAHIFP